MRHIITLSTIPPRFAEIGLALTSLLRQKSRPEAVELYIPQSYSRFPQWGGGLPAVPDGVRIIRTEADFGPATKILPAARAYRGQDVELLFCDDDHVYLPDWAQRILAVRKEHPKAAVCAAMTTVERMGVAWRASGPLPRAVIAPEPAHQLGFQCRMLARAFKPRTALSRRLFPFHNLVRRSGYTDILEGYAGAALRPEFLDACAYDIPPVIWAVDDVWVSGHLTRNGIAIWADKRLNRNQLVTAVGSTTPLWRAVIEGAGRDQANRACVDYMRQTYGIWGGEAVQST